MNSDDPNQLQNEQAAKGAAHQHEMNLRKRIEKVREGLEGLTAADQDYVISEAKRPLKPDGTS
jgi:hypothetical protein